MNVLKGVFVVVILLEITACQGNGSCRSRPYAVEQGRRCRSPCTPGAICKATNKQCLCDGACGWSCFNPTAPCAELEPIIHGSFTADNIMQGKANYRCDTGFILNGTRRRTCCADKNWHPEAPTCLRGCGLPGNLGNAYPDTDKSSFAIDVEVKYKCRTGYYMTGYEYRACRSSGWTSAQYTCHLQTCSALSESVNHGSVEFTPGFYFGSTAKLICDTGYEARDPWRIVTSIRCFAGEDDSRYGEWTGELSSCEIKTCPPPMEPDNGLIRGRSYVGRDYGTQITYECVLGFKLEGSETGECDDNGSWGTMPNCTVDPDCDFDEYSHPTCGYDGDDWERIRVAEVDGLQGYASEATRRYSELTSAVIPSDWTTSGSICLKFNYKLVGTYSSFKISPTYVHSKSDISWRSHGKEVKNTWLDSLLNIRTGNPIQYKFEVIDPTIQLDNIQVLGHSCVDGCDDAPCQNSGTCVSRSAGHTCFCEISFKGRNCETDRRCRKPPGTATNAKLTDTQLHKIDELLPDSTTTYTCNQNYKVPRSGYPNSVVRTVKAYCVEGSSGSNWSPYLYNIRCVEILCTQPPLKSDQELVSGNRWSDWRVGEKATIRCADGYGFVREDAVKSVTCGSNERWNGEYTACQDVRCPSPSTHITKGNRSYLSDDSWFFGAKATYTCNRYHKFSNKNSVVTSTSSYCERRWFGGESYWKPNISSFRCIDRRCPVAPDSTGHARRVEPVEASNTFMAGDRAKYRCEQYHKLSGEGYYDSTETSVTTTCMEGSWNNPSSWSPRINSINCVDRRCPEAPESLGHASRVNASDTGNFLPGSWAEYRCQPHYKLTGHAFDGSIEFGVTTTCNEGHRENPSYWSVSLDNIRCIDRRCSVPPENVQNASRVRLQGTIETFLPGSSATYNCIQNYKLAGPGYDDWIDTTVTTTCMEGNSGTPGYWSIMIRDIGCKAITCSKPDPIGLHRFVKKYYDGKEWNVGQKARYACEKGYEFDPNDEQMTNYKKCTASETWEGSVKRCIENIKCDLPAESISHGAMSNTSQDPFFPNATATYECDYGFKLDGEDGVTATKTVTCKKRLEQLGSEWAPKISTLNCIPITCSTPSAGNHQRIANNHDGKKWNIGEQAIYSCKEGYEFASDDPAVIKTCKNDESWEGTVTKCIENIKCIVPPETITNGERSLVSENPPLPNATVSYRCDPRYKIANENGRVMSKTAVCTKGVIGSEWEPNLSTIHCIHKTCTNPSTGSHQRIEGYKREKLWKVGQQATFSCKKGYKFVSNEPTTTRTCRYEETWEGSITPCIENTECDIPPTTIPNGEQVTSFKSPPPRNTTATYQCSDGFKLENEHGITSNKTIECRKKANNEAGSEWVPEPFQLNCIRLSCKIPNVANGQELTKDKAKWEAGDRATYKCKNGYEWSSTTTNPVTTIVCEDNETWSGTATPCVEDANCEAPRRTIVHGSLTVITSERAARGTTVTYGCEEGYVFENGATSTCTMKPNGEPGSEWLPRLEDITCMRTANVKLDLAVVLPSNQYFSNDVLNAYKGWIKSLGRALMFEFDLVAHFYKYGWDVNQRKYFLRRQSIATYDDVSEFESAVDGMDLTAWRTASYLVKTMMTDVNSFTNRWTRPDASKVTITLVDRDNSWHSSYIADGVDCLKYNDVNAYFVGVFPTDDSRSMEKFSNSLQTMAYNIDNERRWYTVGLSELENSVSELVRTIEEQNLPPDQRNICDALPTPSNRKCRWEDAGQKRVGEKVHLKCRKSYSYYYTWQEDHAQCKSDRSWEKRDSIPCPGSRTRRSISSFEYTFSHCRDPVLPDKAYIINDPVVYDQGTKITLGCLGDNTLIGRKRIKCKASGQWTRTNAVCKANTCSVDAFTLPHDILVDGESIYYETFQAGESIAIECDDPFVLYRDPKRPPIIETEVTCNLGGRWSESLTSFSCDTGSSICACPNKPRNSSIVDDPNHYPVGITITLECDPGFEMIGEDTMTCLQTGHWDDARFRCEANIQDCEPPDLPDQAVIEDDPEEYPPGTTITLDCIGDNNLIGDPRMTCNRVGQWSECEFRCEANVCLLDRVLMPLRMGVEGYTSVEVYDHKFDIDEEATLACDGRQFPFLKDGSDFIQPDIICQLGGRWEPNVYDFLCVTACETPTEPPNARWVREPSSEAYRVGSRISFVCVDGLAYEGDVRTVECQDDGEWSIPEDACRELALDCDAPDLPDLAIIEDDPEEYLTGTMITLDCIGDNDLIGCSRMTCNRFGQWSECESRCQANVCLLDRLLMPVGMGVEGYTSTEVYDHKFDIDEVATLTCDGRQFPFLNGGGNFIQPDITCQPGGRWAPNADDFHCDIACGTPTEPPNARWVREPSSEVYRVGNRISFVCVDGCIYGGDVRTVECEDNGIWSIPQHACIEINECEPNPCRNGGLCTDLTNAFVCECVEGYSGKTCETDIDHCDPDPCQNDGSCINEENDYSCLCPPGYTGKNCQTDIDECSSSPCMNDAECTDQVNGFRCSCQAGFTGDRCETDINDCVPNPCKNGGLCFDRVNDFSCACITGFAGKSCETNINDCRPNPCLNDGRCTDLINGFVCSCQPGYSGHHCQTDIDDCSPNPCLNDAGCTDKVNGFNCSCQAGYTGDRCGTDVDDCSPNPCLNEAECSDLVNGYNCVCQPGYTGDRCQTDKNDCNSNPCKNGATCNDLVADFQCECSAGFTGKTCQTNINDCSPNPCLNGAGCTDQVNGFACSCQPGYSGDRCQTDIDDCSLNPCLNDAECEDQVNGYNCICQPGYSGDRCQTDVDDCSLNPCLNDAECIDQVNGYNCICQPGYTSNRCQTDVDDCSPNPCLNDAECADQVNGYDCICRPGYTGDRCQTDVNDCSPNPCLNDAECMDQVNGYNCICQPGYSGPRCQTDVDDCNPNPCLNDAECEDAVNGYNCICQPGYTDDRCQTDIDECSPNPCLNDAECSDEINGFTCSCHPGYTGDKCQTDEDNCSPDPCKNDGTCRDLLNDFSCECTDGYAGKRCETNIKICDPNPCRHVERCENLVNDFLCHCIPGYTGKRCEDEIDECVTGPCINSGHCTDKVNDFECTCAAGYTGKTCATDVNECSLSPCQHGGNCINRIGTFLCECPPGFTGTLCETVLTTTSTTTTSIASTVSTRSSTTEPTPPPTPGPATTTTTTDDSINYEYTDEEG